MENLYKNKDDFTTNDIEEFINENKDQLKREYIDFRYVVLNPKNLIGIEDFNQDFFDKIDSIENKIKITSENSVWRLYDDEMKLIEDGVINDNIILKKMP